MSVSPETSTATTSLRSPPSPSTTTPAGLAGLLADAYAEVESLRRELSTVRKRTEKAERLAQSLQTLRSLPTSDPSPTSSTNSNSNVPNPTSNYNGQPAATPLSPADEAAAIILAYEDRAQRAEMARDEAQARTAALADGWALLNQHLAQLDGAALDARMGFARVVQEGGGVLVLGQVPSMGMVGQGGRHRGRVFAAPSSFPALPLPPHPSAAGSRRARTPSVDAYGQPPSKRVRGEYDPMYLSPQLQQGPRMILPPDAKSHHLHPSSSRHHHHHHPHRTHSRSSSHSSSSSLSVDEMLLQATTENGVSADLQQQQQQQNLPPPPPPQHLHPQHHSSSRRHSSRRDHHPRPLSTASPALSHAHSHSQVYAVPHLPQHHQQQQPQNHVYEQQQHVRRAFTADFELTARGSPKQTPTPTQAQAAGAAGVPLAQPGQAREFQTHIFAPPVTGAPVKKSKFASGPTTSPALVTSTTLPPASEPAGTPAVTSYPATNEQGQRICRQCGVAGRYKDGKCVEKWGPGPMGAGTVCDRCRKKMKRIERRGTLESQQLMQQQQQAAAQAQARSQSRQQSQSQPIHRTDTLPAHSTSNSHSHAHPQQQSTQFSVSSARGEPSSQSQAQKQPSPASYVSPPPLPATNTPTPTAATNTNTRRLQARARIPPTRVSAPALREMEDAIPTSAVPRGGAGVRNSGGAGGSGGRGTPNGSGGRGTPQMQTQTQVGVKKSPEVMDVDADGDEEDGDADAEIEGLAEGSGSGGEGPAGAGAGAGEGEKMDVDREGEGGAELELLEAVDAAEEANSIGSSAAGRGRSES